MAKRGRNIAAGTPEYIGEILAMIDDSGRNKHVRAAFMQAMEETGNPLEALEVFLNRAGRKGFPTPVSLEDAAVASVMGPHRFEVGEASKAGLGYRRATQLSEFKERQEAADRRERRFLLEKQEQTGLMSQRDRAALQAMRDAELDPPMSAEGRRTRILDIQEEERQAKNPDRRTAQTGGSDADRQELTGSGKAPRRKASRDEGIRKQILNLRNKAMIVVSHGEDDFFIRPSDDGEHLQIKLESKGRTPRRPMVSPLAAKKPSANPMAKEQIENLTRALKKMGVPVTVAKVKSMAAVDKSGNLILRGFGHEKFLDMVRDAPEEAFRMTKARERSRGETPVRVRGNIERTRKVMKSGEIPRLLKMLKGGGPAALIALALLVGGGAIAGASADAA